jgi:hypothetical protein
MAFPATLVRIWTARAEAGELDDNFAAAGILQEYEARIGALERLVGKLALENEFLEGASRQARQPTSATTSVVAGPVISRFAQSGNRQPAAAVNYSTPIHTSADARRRQASLRVANALHPGRHRRQVRRMLVADLGARHRNGPVALWGCRRSRRAPARDVAQHRHVAPSEDQRSCQ